MLARRVVAVSLGDLTRALVPPLLATALSVAAIGALERLFLWSDDRHPAFGVTLLLGETVAFAGVFALAMYVCVPGQSAMLARAARDFVRPARG
jgi:hypothetical protein